MKGSIPEKAYFDVQTVQIAIPPGQRWTHTGRSTRAKYLLVTSALSLKLILHQICANIYVASMEKGGVRPADKDFPGHQRCSDIGKNVLFAKTSK